MKPNQMFLNSLYKIKQILPEGDGSKFSAIIELNPSHEIFNGHFPGNPILPGVCMIQILKELLSNYSDSKLILKNAGSIKYLYFIDPLVNNIIHFDVEMEKTESGYISCRAILNSGSLVFCRFKGEFKIITKH
jgi:3-hydroxyacyl-[acyl-carrier-protein] dehydratase